MSQLSNQLKPIVKGPAKNQKNFRGLRGGITVDAEHPDGFRINDDGDLYEVYGKKDTAQIRTRALHTNMMVLPIEESC